MKRAESQAQTRTALLEAAAEVFGERGLHGASLDDVATWAGVTKGAVYSNFGSKEELFLQGFSRSFERSRPKRDYLNRLIVDGNLDAAARVYQQVMDDTNTAQWLLGIEFLLWARRTPRIRAMAAESLDSAMRVMIEEIGAALDEEPTELRNMVVALAALDMGLGLLEELVKDLDRPQTYVLAASRLLKSNAM